MAGWILPTLLAWALLCGPGALVLRAGGARIGWTWGAAPAVTVVLVVVLGALDKLLGIPWAPWTAAVQLGVLVLVIAGVRWRLAARAGRGEAVEPAAEVPVGIGRRVLGAWPPALGIVVGFAMAAAGARGMGGIDTLNGSYDAFFHIAAVEFVRTDRDGFLFTALQGIYGEPTFYPAAFDVLTALLPGDPITAANAMALAMVAALPGAYGAMVALLLRGGSPLAERRVLPAVAALCAPLSLSVPVIALVMGLWPFVLGALCLPVACGALWALALELAPGRRRAARIWPLLLLLAGTVLAHPSTLFSLAVVVLAALIARGARDVLRPAHRRRGLRELAAVTAVVLLYAAGSRLVLSSMDLTTAAPWPWPQFLASVALERPRIAALPVEVWPVVALWVLAVIGTVRSVAVRGRLGATALVLLVLALVLTVLTNIPSPLARTWVNPWYGARERIAPLLVAALVVLAVLGVRELMRRDRERDRAWRAPVAVALLAATTLTAVLVPGRLPFVGSLAYTAYGVQLAPYVTEQERAFIERSASELPAGSVVIGNPRDGTALYWSLGGVDTVFPTLSEPQTLDSRRVARYAYKAAEDPRVCTSLRHVAPTHLYVDTSAQSGAALSPQTAVLWEGLTQIPADRLVLVDRDGPYALYRIEPLC